MANLREKKRLARAEKGKGEQKFKEKDKFFKKQEPVLKDQMIGPTSTFDVSCAFSGLAIRAQ